MTITALEAIASSCGSDNMSNSELIESRFYFFVSVALPVNQFRGTSFYHVTTICHVLSTLTEALSSYSVGRLSQWSLRRSRMGFQQITER